MSVEAMAWAYSVRLPKQPCAKAVLVALANRANEEGTCYPGLGDLEARTDWNRRTIQRAIKILVDRNLLIVASRCDQKTGKQSSNLYRLALHVRGDVLTPVGVSQRQGEGDTPTPPGVSQRQGEGVVATPESSSEQSSEQSMNSEGAGPLPDPPRALWREAERILGVLNAKAGRNFAARAPNGDPTASLQAAHAVLKKGYTEAQVEQVIESRVVKWRDDPERREFLRPSTLFRLSKFEQYLGQVGTSARPPTPKALQSVPRSERMEGVGRPTDWEELVKRSQSKQAVSA